MFKLLIAVGTKCRWTSHYRLNLHAFPPYLFLTPYTMNTTPLSGLTWYTIQNIYTGVHKVQQNQARPIYHVRINTEGWGIRFYWRTPPPLHTNTFLAWEFCDKSRLKKIVVSSEFTIYEQVIVLTCYSKI